MASDNRRREGGPRRFVRLPSAKEIGELAAQIWQRPRLTVRRTQKGTEFVFRAPFLQKFKKHNPHLYRALFEQTHTSWAKALIAAYSERQGRQKPTKQYIDTLLYNVCVKGLYKVLEGTKSPGDEYGSLVDAELTHLLADARRKRGPRREQHKAEQRAIRLAKRKSELVQLTRELLRFIKKKGKTLDEASIKKEVEKKLKWDTVLKALGKLLSMPEPDVNWRSLTMRWTASDLALHIIQCEEEDKNAPLSVTTIQESITMGNRLLRTRPSVT